MTPPRPRDGDGRSGQGRSGQGRSGQGRSGQGRPIPGRSAKPGQRLTPAPPRRTAAAAPAAGSRRGAAGAAPGRNKVASAQGLGGEQVEGRRAVRELLAAGRRRVRAVWVSDELPPSALLADIGDLAASQRVPVRSVSRGRLAAMARTDAPQGVIAEADPLPEADLDDLAIGLPGVTPFLLLLDGVTDPHNLGALIRTADAAGVTGVILPRHRAVHVTPTVAKASAGAIEHVPLALVAGLPTALRDLKAKGVWIIGLDAAGDTSLFDLPVAVEPVALVVGAEGPGLSRLAKTRCDLVVRIPQGGQLGSLNVSVAGALACYEVARRRSG
ncbi:MAG: 23S rRNA (guanosine(2251)-2'-O)-methyltransferase RlmB [Acidimicrobiales bacterium]